MFPLLALTAAALATADGPAVDNHPQIAGTVQSDGGQPIEGAIVFVSTAGPRKGVGIL